MVPPEFRATYQAGIVGYRLADGSDQISQRTGDLNRLANGADTLADSLGDVRAQVNKIAPSIQTSDRRVLVDEKPIRRRQAGAGTSTPPPSSSHSINALGNSMGVNFTAVKDMFAWIGPVLTALQGNPVCDADPSCSDTRNQFEQLVAARNDGQPRPDQRPGRTTTGFRRPADPQRDGETS